MRERSERNKLLIRKNDITRKKNTGDDRRPTQVNVPSLRESETAYTPRRIHASRSLLTQPRLSLHKQQVRRTIPKAIEKRTQTPYSFVFDSPFSSRSSPTCVSQPPRGPSSPATTLSTHPPTNEPTTYLGHPCDPPCLLHAHRPLSNPAIRVRKRRRAHFGLHEVLQLDRGRLELL